MLGCGATSFGIITVSPFLSLYIDIYSYCGLPNEISSQMQHTW